MFKEEPEKAKEIHRSMSCLQAADIADCVKHILEMPITCTDSWHIATSYPTIRLILCSRINSVIGNYYWTNTVFCFWACLDQLFTYIKQKECIFWKLINLPFHKHELIFISSHAIFTNIFIWKGKWTITLRISKSPNTKLNKDFKKRLADCFIFFFPDHIHFTLDFCHNKLL